MSRTVVRIPLTGLLRTNVSPKCFRANGFSTSCYRSSNEFDKIFNMAQNAKFTGHRRAFDRLVLSNNQQMSNENLPANGKKRVGYVLHGQFTRNNVILTLSSQYYKVGKLAEGLSPQELAIDKIRPCEDVLISLSTGCLGYRNTKQGQYEAAFQTTAKMFKLMEERGFLDHRLELVFRQFSEGREAFSNVLMGKEGVKVRRNVTRVTDCSKIKFGGDRAPGRRRV